MPDPRPRVLLVEDHAAMRARVLSILAREFDVVSVVQDGPSALVAAADLKPDVVVLDLSLPGMSGFDVARCMRDAGSTVPIVFMSAYDDESFVRAALAVGGNAYVAKSNLSQLVSAVLGAIASPAGAGSGGRPGAG